MSDKFALLRFQFQFVLENNKSTTPHFFPDREAKLKPVDESMLRVFFFISPATLLISCYALHTQSNYSQVNVGLAAVNPVIICTGYSETSEASTFKHFIYLF